jgi:phosphate transport system substrate-binding protein
MDLTSNGFRIISAGLPSSLITGYEKAFGDTFGDCRLVTFDDTVQKGLSSFIQGDAELMVASQKMTGAETMKAEQNGIVPEPKLIGTMSLAVITESRNPVNELTLDQLKKIFSGDIVNWNQVGGMDQPIRVVAPAVPQTGVGLAFQKCILEGGPFTKDATSTRSCYTIVEQCSEPGAIGCLPTALPLFRKLNERGIKVLAVRLSPEAEAVIPANGIVKQTAYPITMPVYLYFSAKDKNPCVSKFAYFCAYLNQTACLEGTSAGN